MTASSSGPSRRTPASVIIPAHNEQRVITRLLDNLLADAEPGEFEVIVVCNGCSDGTAETARKAAPAAQVVELPTASKIAALNEGDHRATRYPRLYVDADVEISTAAARATVEALASGPALCAAPHLEWDESGLSWAVRQFYRVLLQTPYFQQEQVGTGVYGLSEPGRARFDDFPEVIADDQFVLELFALDERRSLAGQAFRIFPPRSLRALVRVRTRVYRGNRQLAAMRAGSDGRAASSAAGVARLAGDPRNWAGLAIYVGVNLAARANAHRQAGRWERDETSRQQLVADG